MKQPRFIDFEASSLGPDSYPIEVAWSDPAGGIESHYIDPIDDWTDWSLLAEREIHQISRQILRRHGKPPRVVARRMNEALADSVVYCDGLPYDAWWNQALFEAAGIDPAFRIRDYWTLLAEILPEPYFRFRLMGLGENRMLSRLIRQARKEAPGRRHQAANDVRYLIRLYRLACRAGGYPATE